MYVRNPGAGLCRASLISIAGLVLLACSESNPGGGQGDPAEDASTDIVDDTQVADIRVDASDSGADDADSSEVDDTSDALDTGELGQEGEPCDVDGDCESGVCVDLVPGPDNGFCSTLCVDDSDCPEGADCILPSGGDSGRQVCVPLDLCIDEDGDLYGVGPGCLGADCSDELASINPGAEETCDGFDNDCDRNVDENPVDAGDDCETGLLGACAAGRYECISGGVIDCVARLAPQDEVCDELDNDCDGVVDEDAIDAPEWFEDVDGDRFGNPAVSTTLCDAPAGWVDDSRDCDDGAAAISPVATELCDGLDNDCDGDIDEASASNATTFYADADGDGFGDPAVEVRACAAPEGYVANDDDCDDETESVNPDAIELCNLVDDDCDLDVDESDAADALTFFRDEDGDEYGWAATSIVACAQPEGYVANADDCDDLDELVSPEAIEQCDLIDNDCNDQIDEAGDSQFAVWADVDDDGFGDAAAQIMTCGPVAGFVDNDLDCNDDARAISPDANELCDGVDNNCDDTIDEPTALDAATWYRDSDLDTFGDPANETQACAQPDGFVANAADCDDAAFAVNPAATEVCDGVDNDCNEGIDEASASDAATWFRDGDADTYGNAASSTRACSQPDGYVANANDCNDGNNTINPAATEVCDGVDNDCNEGIDEPSASNAATWYRDADTDGYGTATSTTRACTQPAGYVANASDCNDGNGGVNPAALEVCDNVDVNCNGLGDEPYTIFYLDADGDGYGNAGNGVAACSNPGGRVTNASDCDDANRRRNPGLGEYCDGLDNNCDGFIETGTSNTGRTVEYHVGCANFGASVVDRCFGESWNGQGYMHCHYHQSWDNARARCLERGMDLADMNSADEHNAVIGAFNLQDGQGWDDLWIGGRENGTTRHFNWVRSGINFWANGSTGQYSRWNGGEPSNDSGGSNDDCVSVYQGNSTNWNDRNCGGTIEFICEW